jgi:hypothetical protein
MRPSHFAGLLSIVFCLPSLLADDTPATQNETEAPVTIEAGDVAGQPEQDLVKVTNARYFVWHDSKGWHLRTAAKALTQFSGSIRIKGGSFGKLRPIGLEAKARNPDRWAVDAERTEVRFEIHTVGSFDGFDFDIVGDPTSRVVFDLSQGRTGRRMPMRIFLGRDSKHPQKSRFECTAHPDKAADAAAQR